LYDYVDENNAKQTINFATIAVDTTIQTYALGDIEESASFTLGPQYKFKGKVRLNASKENLTFSGFTQIKHDCNKIPSQWFYFSTEVDPREIYIPINEVENEKAAPLYNGVIVGGEPLSMYGLFLNELQLANDQTVSSSKGFLFYDRLSKEYKISSLNKLNQFALPGEYISLHTEKCEIYTEGRINLAVDLGRVETQIVGSVTHDLVSDSTTFDLVMLIDFFFEDKAIRRMADNIVEDLERELIQTDRGIYTKSLQELVGKDQADRLLSDISLYGNFRRFPSSLEKTMLLSDVKMVWNEITGSYQSVGQIGVGNILKKQYNRKIDGKIEIIKKRSGDIIHIYLEADAKNWYYFSYTREIMSAVSSNDEFNTIIREVKSGKNKLEKEKGKARYSYVLSSPQKKTAFLKRFDD